ncbi:Protein DA1-related 1 [Morella rubra]|uniref:Protein DA1-related 1 n=1 Tax=Morella rubra TaxID=262757 RepID=A0A6A1VVE5_9ROSI|nr:Protein DA1-related 1 [Morella rubra]
MTKLGAGKSLPTNWGITFCPMSWLTKLLRGSSRSGQYHGKHPEERIWDEARNSVDELTDIEREEIDCAIALSLSEEDHKGKKVIDDEPESEEDEHLMKALSEEDEHVMKALSEDDEHLPEDRSEEDEHLAKAQLEEDEQLAKALQESMSVESPPRYDNRNIFEPFPFFFPAGYRICAGCNTEIGHGRYLSCMGGVWHPQCFRCNACKQPITDYEVQPLGVN